MAITYLGAKRLQGLKVDRKVDSLGSSADGTNTGVSLIPIKDYAVFDGSNDYITFATKFNQMQQAGSFSVWLKPSNISSTGNDIIFDNSDASSSNNGFTIRHSDHSGGKTLVLFGIWGSTDSSITTDSEILTGDEWQHLCVTYDGTTGKIYRNGVLQKSGSMTANSSAGTYNARIGWSANGNDHKFEGGMYQALVYNDALTQSEVTTLYNSGTPVTSPSTSGLVSKYNLSSDTNDSQGSNNGTNTGVTFSTDNYKLGSGAYSLSGTNPLYFANAKDNKLLPETGDFTIACWVKHSGHSDHQQIFRSQDSSGSSKGEFRINHSGTSSQDDRLALALNDGTNGTGGNSATVMTTNAVPQNEWVHLACTRTGATVKLYINGVLETNQNTSGTFSANMKWGNDTPRVGRMENNAETLQGSIDDLAVWHRVLSATEIGKLANNNDPAWTLPDSSKINIASNVLNWENGGSQTVKYGYRPITALSDTQWTMRFKITIDQYASPSGDAHQLYVNLQENAVNAEGNSKGVGFGIRKGTGTNGYRIMNQNSTSEIAAGTMTAFSRTATTETIYIELARTTATNLRGRIYTDSSFSTLAETINATIASSLNGLDNIVISTQQDNGSGGGLDGTIDDIKIWNGTNTTSGTPDYQTDFSSNGGDAQLVSSLSNKAGLKAHYGMNTANGTTASLDDDLSSYADQAAADNVWKSSDTAKVRVNISDDDIDFNSVEDDSNDSISYELGSTLSNTEWICRFKFNISTADNSGLAPGTDRHAVAIGLFDVDETVGFHSSTSKSGIYLDLHLDRDGTDRAYFARQNDATNSLDGAGQTGWSGFSTGTDYYCEIKRTSDANATMTIRTGSHTGSTALGTPRNLTTCAGIDNLKYFGIKCSQWGYGGQLTGIIDDVQIWSGTTDPDATFCTNDASTTSELDGMTNLPTNTIFLQTDDTPSYWWKQSDDTWKLDGGSEINVPMTASSWTFQGNQGSAHTHSIDNGVKWVSQYANNKTGAGVAVGTIGATLGSKWVARYNWTGTGSYTEGGNGYVIIGLSDDGTYGSSDTTNTQGGDSAQVQWHIGNNSGDRHYRVRGWNGGSGTDGNTTGGDTVPWVAETQYFELSYDGTTLKHQRYTDSTYSTAHSVVTPTKDISGITGLTHIIFGSNDTGHSHGGFTLTLNEFKIQKGFSEWQ